MSKIIDEEAQMYIDIISINPKLDKYQKYKDILKNKFGIEYDKIDTDNDLIGQATLSDIKKPSDFLNFDNWLKYAKIISKMRGFIPMNLYDTPSDIMNDEVWNKFAKKLKFRIEKVPYIERRQGSGDIARAFGDKITYTEQADLYYFLHELGHIYDFKKQYKGIAKNPAYSPTNYGTTNAGETFAEIFAIYFIAPNELKKWNIHVYAEMDSIIDSNWKNELKGLVVNSFERGGSTNGFNYSIGNL